jgi:hypothetical protein
MSEFVDWLAHGIKEGRVTKDRRMLLRLSLCLVLLTAVAGTYLALVSRTAAQGRHIQQLEQELFDTRAENEHLEVLRAQEGSIQRLLRRAAAGNYVQADQVDYLTIPAE